MSLKVKKYGLNRLTESARSIIQTASHIAIEAGDKQLEPIHIFYAILINKNSINTEVLTRIGIDIDSTILSLKNLIYSRSHNPNSHNKITSEIDFSNNTKQLINESFKIASELGHVYVGTEHILLALFKLENIEFLRSIKDVGINYELIKNAIINIGNYSALNEALKIKSTDSDYEKKEDELEYFDSIDNDETPMFCNNLNQMAMESRFLNITGRDEEIQRLIHILSRKTKNNPILVGEAGVGKTAIVEGFVNLILAGSKLRGDIEERVNSVIESALEDGNVILFIDEIHMIVGAGSSGMKDSLDIANLLKPYLTNYNLSIIGATTIDEYSKYFESDSALSRRFQPIKVSELDIESSKKVLYAIKRDFEKFHKVRIPNEVIDFTVYITNKYIKNRYLPDKAIDVIDEACAAIKIGREMKIQPSVSNLARKLVDTQNQKNYYLSQNNYEKASELKKKEEKLIKNIQSVLDGINKIKGKNNTNTVNIDIIKNVVYEWTKIPIVFSNIQNKTFKNVYQNLKKHIIGQDRVLNRIAKSIQKAHLGLNGEQRPIASFLFLGPSGVGKTETAKAIAQEVFGSKKFLYQINMSEFMEPHSVSKLIGAPPGYVGYQEGGTLSSFVKSNPYSVVLFDELEKAHIDVMNILLQILDEGELTDGKGTKVNFKNTIIVITSNIGADMITRDSKLGFNVDYYNLSRNTEIDRVFEEMRSTVLEQLKKQVKPELINRIDIIEVFRGLNKDDSYEITKLLVDELKIKYIQSKIYLEIGEDIITYINENGYSKEYGVRNLKRSINDLLENKIIDFLLDYEFENKKRKSFLNLRAILESNEVKITEQK